MDEMNYDTMGKEALRAECREREISYGKLDNAGMRAALKADDASHAEFGGEEAEFEMGTAELEAQKLRPAAELTPADKQQVANEAATRPARATRTGLKIEANREQRNGIKRPSAGGVCRAVWDECDRIVAGGGTPVAKTLRQLAEGRNWNANNTMIEFYQWRKFNGITGRTAK